MLSYLNLKKCIHQLLIHRLRTFLSTLGILFGVTAVITMISIGEGAKKETLEQIEQLGMNHLIIRSSPLTEDQQAEARKKQSQGLLKSDIELFQKILPFSVRYTLLNEAHPTLTGIDQSLIPSILAVTSSFKEIKGLQLAEGRFICDQDESNKAFICVLGYELAKKLGKNGHINQMVRLNQKYFKIVGVLKSTQWKTHKNNTISTRNLDEALFIPFGIDSLFLNPLEKQRISEVIIEISNLSQMNASLKLLKAILNRRHGGYEDYQIIIPQELFHQALKTHRTFNMVLGSLAAISLLVGGIGIMNIMLATISERTREIGIRRAVGATKEHILVQFLLETLLLSLVGGALGIITGIGLAYLISYLTAWPTVLTWWSMFLALIVSSLVGLFSGLYPACKAAKMHPVQALRF